MKCRSGDSSVFVVKKVISGKVNASRNTSEDGDDFFKVFFVFVHVFLSFLHNVTIVFVILSNKMPLFGCILMKNHLLFKKVSILVSNFGDKMLAETLEY